jgi:tripartite motif-containing protein 2/3/tripartite motif-containing protein 71
VTPVPGGGTAGLQSAFRENRLLQILESSKNPAATPEVPAPTDANPVKKAGHCFVHEGKELELYCDTCGELICSKCALKGGKHHDHDYDELHQAFEKYKAEITSSLEPMEKQVTTTKRVLTQLYARRGEISDQQAATADNIHVTFRRLREVLDVRETELIGQLDTITQGKLKCLATQTDQIETTLAQLNSCLHFMRESLRTDDKEDVLMMKSNTVQQVKELTTPLQPDILKPNTETDLQFSTIENMLEACRNYGEIFLGGPPDPSKCHLTGKHVRFIGTPIQTLCEVKEPRGVAINQRGEVVVSECGGHCVSVFSHSGKKLLSFGTRGSDLGQFNYPREIALDDEGNILVADSRNHRIQKFTPGGLLLTSAGTKGSGPLQFKHPAGIAFNASNSKWYVTDTRSNRVQVLNSDLTFSSTFGGGGYGKGHFNYPAGVACDSTGRVYVVDTGNHRIQVFTMEEEFTMMFGRRGQGRGELDSPYGIAITTSDMVYVSEEGNNRVSVFTSEGQFVTSFGRKGKGPGCFQLPRGLAVDNSGVVYVCDRDNNRVQIILC